MVNALEVLEDGTHTEVCMKSEALDSAKVYCVVDHTAKNIFIWLGQKANVRLRFVGAQTAASVRSDIGLHYKVLSIDEGEEPNSFIQVLNAPMPNVGTQQTTT